VLTRGTDGGTKAKPPVSPSLAALLALKTLQSALQTNGLSDDLPNRTTPANYMRVFEGMALAMRTKANID
jgi:hypothetical protein